MDKLIRVNELTGKEEVWYSINTIENEIHRAFMQGLVKGSNIQVVTVWNEDDDEYGENRRRDLSFEIKEKIIQQHFKMNFEIPGYETKKD